MAKKNVSEQYQIFCDLDGVLVDLYKGIENAINGEAPEDASEKHLEAQRLAKESLGGEVLEESHLNKRDENFRLPVRNFMFRVMRSDRRFWMNLPWLEDGKKLWEFIKDYEPIILSKPMDLQSVIGKKVWTKRNLGLNKSRVQIRHDKTKYATYNGKTGLLIDDYAKNITAFSENGGQTIHFKNLDEALEQLKEYGFGNTTRARNI